MLPVVWLPLEGTLLQVLPLYMYSTIAFTLPFTVGFITLQNCVAEVDWEPDRTNKQYKLEYWHAGRAGKVRIATLKIIQSSYPGLVTMESMIEKWAFT